MVAMGRRCRRRSSSSSASSSGIVLAAACYAQLLLLLLLLLCCCCYCCAAFTIGGEVRGLAGMSTTTLAGTTFAPPPPPPAAAAASASSSTTIMRMANKEGGNGNGNGNGGREDEIRRKIAELKQEGKLKPKANDDKSSPAADTPLERTKSRSAAADVLYAEKLGSKLGKRRGRQVGRMLGINVPAAAATTTTRKETTAAAATGEEDERGPRLGALDADDDEIEDYDDDYDDDGGAIRAETEEERRERTAIASGAASDAIDALRRNVDDGEAGGGDDDDDDEEMDEEDMVDAVARALSEAGGFRSRASSVDDTDQGSIATVPASAIQTEVAPKESVQPSSAASTGQKTSGVGGSWAAPKEQTSEDAYQPKVGTWGAFPRPKNISVAYGGGKKVGAGVKSDETLKRQSIESTQERLRAYRERMGIVVQSEKDNADIIEDALQLAARAMQRGSYSAGVSALEKVTQYCSTRSKVGGKVFLELAMAYEAEGKTDEAIGLYAALTKSPIEQIKANADKLLYGLEAMNFMRNEAKLKDFSRKKAGDTFIDATGFNDITKNFDKVYNTAYIDLDKGGQYYRMLTENVVRSTREARQILLAAVSARAVERIKVVQALRSISRHFDDALVAEKKAEEAKNVPVDYAGRPIVSTQRRGAEDDLASAIGMDGFVLSKPDQMLANLDGEWRLQLMADRKGDGVDYFNSTLIWQAIDTSAMSYSSEFKGLRSSSQSGNLIFDEKERILSREGTSAKAGMGAGGGLLSMLLGGGGGTAGEMTKAPQQILLVDSALLVTRAIVKAQAADNVKDYFSVWRRVDPGTFVDES